MKTVYGHLTYCTNIHAGESWDDHFNAIRHNFPVIKEQLNADAPMGIGLRLSNIASVELINPGVLQDFKDWLKQADAYVFTMNGFPYGGFHHTRVKDQVHAPDWTTTERLDYTRRLFNILAELVPAGMDGGVSTSPLSYRYWFNSPALLGEATQKATRHIIDVACHLVDIHKSTGTVLHLDIEPEPDGLLETGEEFIEWFNNSLLPQGTEVLQERYTVSAMEAERMLKNHIRLCYDVCHFAIGYEPHAEVIAQLNSNEIKIGKFQISAALKALFNGGDAQQQLVRQAFSKFNESTYLHQVIARQANGEMIRYTDLPEALAATDDVAEEWRAHFHVPVFEEQFGVLQSTRSDIIEVLQLQVQQPVTQHLEVETYTWEVLHDQLKLPIEQSIIRELQWVKAQLA